MEKTSYPLDWGESVWITCCILLPVSYVEMHLFEDVNIGDTWKINSLSIDECIVVFDVLFVGAFSINFR